MIFTPHGYQQYCIDRIIPDRYLGLFLDMGLGKTVITLTAVNELIYNRFEVGRVLVIALKKVAESTWTDEAGKWEHLKHLRISRILGTLTQRIRVLNTPADIYIINRENVPWGLLFNLNAEFCFAVTFRCKPSKVLCNNISRSVSGSRAADICGFTEMLTSLERSCRLS